MNFDAVDRKILSKLQVKFPLVASPYQVFGAEVGLDEAETIRRVQALKAEGVLRQLSPIYDTRMLGYKSSLVATSFPPERVDQGAAIISSHPGVSHNYQRNHPFNVWFTLAVPPGGDLEGTVAQMGERAGATAIRILPTLKLYKIGVNLDIMGDRPPDEKETDTKAGKRTTRSLTPFDIEFIRATQDDLLVTSRPFDAMAEKLGISLEELFATFRRLEEEGFMRRFAAVLRHQQAGFAANGMAVWIVPEDQIDKIGFKMASFKTVSHCYRRPIYPDWPYNVFTMIHGRTKEDCEKVAKAIEAETGIHDYQMLYSTKEYKKERVRYFVEAEWDPEKVIA